MKRDKPVLLLNWNYYRIDITESVLQFADTFELVFLHDYHPSENTGCVKDYKRIFWNNYSSPYEILDDVQPSKILFYDIESFHQVSLTIAARNRKIKTFVLEHGLRGSYEINIEIQKYYTTRNNHIKVKYPNTSIPERVIKQSDKTLKFYLSAINWKNIFSLHWIFLFIYYRKKFGLTYGLYKIKRKFRWADYYINFTERNASYIKERDGVELQRFRLIGNPSFDSFFSRVNSFQQENTEPYLLLLDAPFVEGDVFGMTPDQKNSFIEKLNQYALNQGMRLYVKLHPISYKSDFYIKHENIKYFTVADIVALILNSKSCAHVHLSSLVPVAILYKPYIFFNAYPEYNHLTEQLQMKSYDYFNFNVTDLAIHELDKEQKERVKNEFLFSIDGRSTVRLKRIINRGL